MADQDLIKVASGIVEAFNSGDWAAARSALAADALYDEVGTSRRIQGAAAFIECLQAWKHAMPDVKGTVNHVHTAHNLVVLELTWKGTQTGPLQGAKGAIPATGKQQVTRACWVMDFAGGKLKESRQYFDMLSFLQQLGVIPS